MVYSTDESQYSEVIVGRVEVMVGESLVRFTVLDALFQCYLLAI